MNQKGFAKIVLIILVVILAGAVGYFILFKSLKPSIAIISPTGGETWEVGKTYPIRWTTKGRIDKVMISLYPHPQGKIRFSEVVSNTGSYAYTVPKDEPTASYDPIVNKFQIYISDTGNNAVIAESQPFSIVPSLASQRETTNWKNFQQESGLYTLKYPSNWDVMSAAGDSEGADAFGFKNNTGGVNSVVTVGYSNQLRNRGGKVTIVREEPFVISGISGKKQTIFSSTTNHQFDRVMVVNGILTFSISLDNPQYTSEWNQILSTFKFKMEPSPFE